MLDYIKRKDIIVIEQHARDFIVNRLAPAKIANDGRQTPMKGHPVFIAQHATATCCRGCLEKWYGIPRNRELTDVEIDAIVSLIMAWMKSNMV